MEKNKLNNKGYMLVEIILASVIAFALAYFMIELTLKLKNKNDDLLVETLTTTDRAIISNSVMSYMKELNAIEAKNFCNDLGSKISLDGDKKFYLDGKFITQINKFADMEISNSTCETLADGKTMHLTIPLKIVNTKKDESIDLYYYINIEEAKLMR